MKAGLLPRLARSLSLSFAAALALAAMNARAQVVVVGGTGQSPVQVNLDALNKLQTRAAPVVTQPAAPALPGVPTATGPEIGRAHV